MLNETGRASRSAQTRIWTLLLAGSALSFVGASPALAVGTQAGTQIENIATATYTPPSGTGTVSIESNEVVIVVDEVLDVTVDWTDPANVVVTSPAEKQKLKFQVTNNGNGPEQFALSANTTVTGDQFDPTNAQIYLDSNGNGGYDEGTDVLYTGNEPVLAPDASMTIFVLANIPSGRTDQDKGHVVLTATAITGSGTPGTVYTGQGQGGGDAVVGLTTASANDQGTYIVSNAMVTLQKGAIVLDRWGGTSRVPGSVITYSIVATVNGSGSVSGLTINDAVPAGTTYVANSMTLAGAALTDVTGDDAGTFASNAISVALGTVAAPATQTVTFKVKIADQ